MKDPSQIKVGNIVLILEGRWPGISMVVDPGVVEGYLYYRRLVGLDLKKSCSDDRHDIRLHYVDKKLDRRMVARLFEKIRGEIEEAERILSDAMFEGIKYVTKS